MAQTNESICKQQLKAQPYFTKHNDFAPADSIEKDLQILVQCGQPDSADGRLIGENFIRDPVHANVHKQKKFSYTGVLRNSTAIKKAGSIRKTENR